MSSRTRARDEGVALPELLIGVVVSGMLIAVLMSALVAILRQSDNTEGRLRNSRSETGIGIWLPADLASADTNVTTGPADSPCGNACPANINMGGSSAMLLSWTSLVPNVAGTDVVTQTTKVNYRYVFVGGEYQLIRIQCVSTGAAAPSCYQTTVLHNLDGPPAGFTPGVTSPSWILQVTVPYNPADTGNGTSTDPGLTTKNAQRVTVTINGGGDASGNGGGSNQISLSAGGASRQLIDAASLQGAPNLIAARSRCGGAIALIVDESGSIGSAYPNVKTGVQKFVEAFAGTPTKLKIVQFDSISSTLGSGLAWTKYYDMLVPADVTDMLAHVNSDMSVKSGGNRGKTNWEDGLFRTFYNADGTIDPVLPGMVVFFTDGVPTRSRLVGPTWSSSSAPTSPPDALPGYSLTDADNFNQQAFYRANYIAQQFRDTTRFIGVGVGAAVDDDNAWVTSVPGWHYEYLHNFHYVYTHSFHYDYTHSYHYNYTHSYHWDTYTRWYHIEKGFNYTAATTVDRGYHLEKNTGSTATPVWTDDATATATSTLGTAAGQYRIRFTTPFRLVKTGLSMTAKASVDMVSTWTAPASGSDNRTKMLTQDIALNPATDVTDGWANGRTYASPYSYWELNTSTTTPSSSSPNYRVKFSAPYNASVAVNPASAPTTDGALAMNTTTTGTNGALFAAADNDGAATDNSDGWTRGTNKVYTTPFLESDVDTVGTGYTTTDASWVKSAKLYSTPFTESDVDPTGTGYSSTDPSWSKSGKVYTSPFTGGSDVDNVGAGYSDTDPSWSRVKSYTSPYTLSEASDGTGYANTAAWTRTKAYTTPFTAFDAPVTTPVRSDKIIARLVAGNDTGVPAVKDGTGKYTNAKVATMYVLPDWLTFPDAMQQIALSECGGTLTLQTRNAGVAAADPFTYQKTKLYDSDGTAITSDMTVVTTTKQFPSGTFDLNITDGTYQTMEIQPQNLSDLAGYTPVGWACKAGVSARTFTVIPIPGSTFTGIKVKVAANEAVSCTLSVTR